MAIRKAYVRGDYLNVAELTCSLNAAYPELELQTDDLVIIDGLWTIDGMDPYEWCEAMMMD
jgi:hypothetical protein